MLAVFLFTFKDFHVNPQLIVIIAFLSVTIILCLWVVLEITGLIWFRDILVHMKILPRKDEIQMQNNRISRRPTRPFLMVKLRGILAFLGLANKSEGTNLGSAKQENLPSVHHGDPTQGARNVHSV